MRSISIRAMVALAVLGACSRAPAPAPAPTPTQPAAGQGTAQRPQSETPPDTERPQQGTGRGGRGGQGGDQQQGQQADAAPRPYARVITADAQTRAGLFKVH